MKYWRKLLKKTFKLGVISFLVGGFINCAPEINSRDYARCEVPNVRNIPMLFFALEAPGEFVMIWKEWETMNFSTPRGADIEVFSLGPTALTAYIPYHSPSRMGFIVGNSTFNTNTLGNPLFAYDRACPNHVYSPHFLEFIDASTVFCSQCRRVYDLNNWGQIIEGERGSRLATYRAYITGDRLIIHNP